MIDTKRAGRFTFRNLLVPNLEPECDDQRFCKMIYFTRSRGIWPIRKVIKILLIYAIESSVSHPISKASEK
jgi:hypothetical protein